MYLKSLALAAATSLVTLTANAATPGQSFSDVELGSIALFISSNVSGAIGFTPYSTFSTGIQLIQPPLTFDAGVMQRIADGIAITTNFSGGAFSFSAINAGAYSLITAPIPEPESFALFLAGLGLVGVVTKHRKKRSMV